MEKKVKKSALGGLTGSHDSDRLFYVIERNNIMEINQETLKARMIEEHGPITSFPRKDLIAMLSTMGADKNTARYLVRKMNKVSKGVYSFGETQEVQATQKAKVSVKRKTAPKQKRKTTTAPAPVQEAPPSMALAASVSSMSNDSVFIPSKDDTFVPWGHFKDLKTALKSQQFFPFYIAGLSGNGKTFMVEQACAQLGREYVRVQISPETDEDDLIGGFRLINGETVFQKGPVLKAMESGAVLLIDEIDRGTNKIMCLQGVLEGKPVLVKKTGEVVSPATGFTVVATANTKGRGSDDGRYSAAGIIDDAFLERFPATLEQPYPSRAVETKIVKKHMEKFECVVEKFADKLTAWSEVIRKTFEDGGVEEFISTRRLCHIVQTYSIFQDEKKSIEFCIRRFDNDTKDSFNDLYDKLGDEVPAAAPETLEETA